MKKRVFIAHGWGGYPEKGWFPWIKRELDKRGFEVFIPAFSDTENPRIFNWVPALEEMVGTPDENTYFIGHRMGCQAIARYLESLDSDVKVGGAVFVAGFFEKLTGLDETKDDRNTVTHWLGTPIDFSKVKSHLPKSIAIFSDDESICSARKSEFFQNKT